MDLKSILEKSKHKIKEVQKPLHRMEIAVEDRPYTIDFNKQTETKGNVRETERKQSGNNQVPFVSLDDLVGLQRKIIFFFFNLAEKRTPPFTGPVTLDDIEASLNIKKAVAKTTIIRLQKKGFLSRKGKTGREGWTTYELTNPLYQTLLAQKTSGLLNNISQSQQGRQTNE